MPGFVLTWAPVPTGRAPHTRVAPCRSQLSRAEDIGGLLRPVVAPPSGARHVLPSSTRAFQPWGHFQPPFILPGRRQNLPEGEPSALCRFRYTRARGRGQQLGALQGQPPAGGPMEAPLQSARPKERPPGRERQLRRHGPRPPERGGGTAAATLEDYAPVRKAQAPVWGLRSSGRAPSRQRGLPAGVMFYVGAGPPRVRAPSSRAPVSTTAQKAQLIGCRVRRGCRVFGDHGARRPRDVAQAESGG